MADKSMDGKVALVTGAGSGIGRATALAFAREGARVVVSDVTDAVDETVRLIQESGGEAMIARADVSKPEQVEAMVKAAVDAYGRLDYAFNNAGIGGLAAPAADYTIDAWDKVISVNLTGVWLCMKYEIQQMLKQGGGVIVNNASILGLVGYRAAPAYVTAKHGVVGLTKAAALDYAQSGIRVNAVCPGFIHTPLVDKGFEDNPEIETMLESMHPVGRMGESEEISGVVVFLCSEAASFITGQPITVDGGYVAQ
jgi:NAD(P)-dependent dehydrogenase (short-subunit alcohol dehydrogenase family)